MKVNFGRMMLQNVRKYSKEIAIANVEKNRILTYQELHELTNKTCNMLKERFGLKGGDVFGTLLENDNTSLFSVWMLKTDLTGIWFNYKDSLDEHLYQIDYVGLKIIFLEKEILDKANYYNELRKRNIIIVSMDKPEQNLDGVYYFWDLIEKASDAETDIEYDMDDHIVLFRFTGGTTGRGKCVMYTFRNVWGGANNVLAQEESKLDVNTRHLHLTPLSHASASYLLPIFFNGATSYTVNTPDLHYFCKTVEEHKITSTLLVPTLLYLIDDQGLEKIYDLSSLETIIYGASPMSPSKLESLQSKIGNIFSQGYGSSEAWPSCLSLKKSHHALTSEEDRKKLASAGQPVTGVEVRIVDDDGNDVPIGKTGELWIRGANVVKGYYKNPEETRKGFSEHGFWKSGDMGYIDEEGFIYIVDRKKDMIISGGFNVYAIEVENALNSHPAVQQSAVVGIPHEKWGEAVHGEVVLKQNTTVSEEELIDYVKNRIGKYKVPKTITIVEELPLTSVGKVLRRKVREKYWENAERKVH